MPPIGDNDQAFTDQFPRYSEKTFHIAPQTDPDMPANTGFQTLHFLDYTPSEDQNTENTPEYGGGSASVDATDPDFGDITVSGNIRRRLCLNEEALYLAYALGRPETVENGDGTFTHIYTSGKSILPLGTIRDADTQNTRLVDGVAWNSLSLAIAQGGGRQEVSSDLTPRGITLNPPSPLDDAAQLSAVDRLFVRQNQMRVMVDNVQLGRLLDGSLEYNADIQTERYVEPGDRINATYVGDPTLAISFGVRHVTEAQRAALGGPDAPLNVKIVGDGPVINGIQSSITFEVPRVIGPRVLPEKDDKLQRLNFAGNASRGTTDWMLRVTLINTFNPFI